MMRRIILTLCLCLLCNIARAGTTVLGTYSSITWTPIGGGTNISSFSTASPYWTDPYETQYLLRIRMDTNSIGNCIDSSVYGCTVSNLPAPATSATIIYPYTNGFGVANPVANFNGAAHKLQAWPVAPTNNITFVAWVRRLALGSGYQLIMSTRNSAVWDVCTLAWANEGGGEFVWPCYNAPRINAVNASSNWLHLVGTYRRSDGFAQLWTNAVFVGQVTNTRALESVSVVIGNDPSSQRWIGDLDGLRISTNLWTATDVTNDYLYGYNPTNVNVSPGL